MTEDETDTDFAGESGSKTCRVFAAYYSVGGELEPPQQLVSQEDLLDFADLPQDDRFIDRILYHSLEVRGAWMLTMHKPLNEEFLSRIGRSGVQDLSNETEPEGNLAHSTAVLFLNDNYRVALLKGDRSSPGAGDFQEFLKKWFHPPATEQHWSVNPLLREDQIQRIEEASGLLETTLAVDAADDLFRDAQGEDAPSFSRAARVVGHDISPNAKVTIGVKLDVKAYTAREAQALKESTLKELNREHRDQMPGSVELLDAEGKREIVNLLKDQISLPVHVEAPDPDNASFTALASGLLAAKHIIEERVSWLDNRQADLD